MRRYRDSNNSMHQDSIPNGMPPPQFPTDDLKNTFNYLPLSQIQFSVDTPQHAPGFTPHQYYPSTSTMPFEAPQQSPIIHLTPPVAPVFVVPLPFESPTFVARPTVMLPRSNSELMFKIPDY